MNNGGPAFPSAPVDAPNHGMIPASEWGGDTGMTLRDYFAGQALSGFCSNASIVDGQTDGKWLSRESFKIADAMIAERSKE